MAKIKKKYIRDLKALTHKVDDQSELLFKLSRDNIELTEQVQQLKTAINTANRNIAEINHNRINDYFRLMEEIKNGKAKEE